MFNVPVKNISLIPIELNKYDVTDTSVNYAEIKDVVPLNPMEVSLSKARPEVTLPSIKDKILFGVSFSLKKANENKVTKIGQVKKITAVSDAGIKFSE